MYILYQQIVKYNLLLDFSTLASIKRAISKLRYNFGCCYKGQDNNSSNKKILISFSWKEAQVI